MTWYDLSSSINPEKNKLTSSPVRSFRFKSSPPFFDFSSKSLENWIILVLFLTIGCFGVFLGFFVFNWKQSQFYFSLSFVSMILSIIALIIESEWIKSFLIIIFPGILLVTVRSFCLGITHCMITHLIITVLISIQLFADYNVCSIHLHSMTICIGIYCYFLMILKPAFVQTESFPYVYPDLIYYFIGCVLLSHLMRYFYFWMKDHTSNDHVFRIRLYQFSLGLFLGWFGFNYMLDGYWISRQYYLGSFITFDGGLLAIGRLHIHHLYLGLFIFILSSLLYKKHPSSLLIFLIGFGFGLFLDDFIIHWVIHEAEFEFFIN